MNLPLAAASLLIALLLCLFGVTRLSVVQIERRHPPVGAFVEIDGARIHYVHVPAAGPDLPAVVFLHGASANLLDQMVPLRPLLEGHAEMLFFDRPGLGWSERGTGNGTPDGQARLLGALMDRLGIERAILVAHSFGASVATALALDSPDRVAGLVYVSAATHPWRSGATSWYYKLTVMPVVGWLFSQTLVGPAGAMQMAGATACVFAPNAVPPDYLARAGIGLVLRPAAFRANAEDVESLNAYARANAPRYPTITAPAVVISGDSDTVVYEEIHSAGLARDLPNARAVWVHNLGHKPDWIAPDLVAAAIRSVAGQKVDLEASARAVEARIAQDRHGEGRCAATAADSGEFVTP
ncbi:MAG: alpha/beta hydrolase [Rhizobiaceae bacterium]|nr:alpha/beta hydrolase [Rhizobiaceae bacterium]